MGYHHVSFSAIAVHNDRRGIIENGGVLRPALLSNHRVDAGYMFVQQAGEQLTAAEVFMLPYAVTVFSRNKNDFFLIS